jgi:hypothetical protein
MQVKGVCCVMDKKGMFEVNEHSSTEMLFSIIFIVFTITMRVVKFRLESVLTTKGFVIGIN